MSPKLEFRLDYLSDLVNLIFILGEFDKKPYPWDHGLKVDKERIERLKQIDKKEFKQAEKKRVIGNNFEEWRNKCKDKDFWSLIEKIHDKYHEYWNSKRNNLEEELKNKRQLWNNKFENFFKKARDFTGLRWGNKKYINIISDSVYMGGYWDTLNKNVVYTGAYTDEKIYRYILPHELLHLLIEKENFSTDFFNIDGYPNLLTHDIMENLIGVTQSGLTDMDLKECLQFLTYSPNRRWVLMKVIIKEFDPKKDLQTIAKNIKKDLNSNLLEKYKKIYEMEDPKSILLD